MAGQSDCAVFQVHISAICRRHGAEFVLALVSTMRASTIFATLTEA
jgi:hypothetical protein